MKKNVKKCVFGVLAVVMLAGLFTGCKSQAEGTCYKCKEEHLLYEFSMIDETDKSNCSSQLYCESCAKDMEKLVQVLIDGGHDYLSYKTEKYYK